MLGLELMFENLLKSMGLTPDAVKQYGGELRGFAQSLAQNMQTMRRDQLRIMEKLGIPITEGQTDGQDNRGTGSGTSACAGNDRQTVDPS